MSNFKSSRVAGIAVSVALFTGLAACGASDAGDVVDDVVDGAEDLGEDVVDGAEDLGEDVVDGAEEVVDGAEEVGDEVMEDEEGEEGDG